MPSLMRKLCLGVVLIATACGPERPPGDTLERWTLSEKPTVSIGELEGDPGYLFQQVEAAFFASNGRILVVDAGLGVLRLFDDEGRFLVEMGGKGEGPGEFSDLRDAWMVSPDTVGVWDSGAARLTYFSVDGSFLRSHALRADPNVASGANLDMLIGGFSDGSVVIGWIEAGAPVVGQLSPDRIALMWFDSTGAFVREQGEVIGLVRGSRGPVPFSPFPYHAVFNDSVYFTHGLRPTMLVRDRTWSEGRVVSFPEASQDVPAAWATFEAELRAREHPFVGFLPVPQQSDSLPHIAGLLVDDRGNVWTKQFDPAQDALWLANGKIGGGHWWVADEHGTLIASVQVPAGLVPLQVFQSSVLGLMVDALGVQRVSVYPIIRSE